MPLAGTAGRNFGKYFLHGIAFSLIFLVVGIAWAVITVLLVVCGLFLGLAIALVLLFVLMGYVNSFVTEALWFPVRTASLTCLGHGLLLFLALLPLNLIVLGVQAFVTPNILVALVIFVATAPIAGFLAKSVASLWRTEAPPAVVAPPPIIGVDPAMARVQSYEYSRR